VDRITELRRQLGRLAARLGDRDTARNFLELTLAQEPDRPDVLNELAVLYVDDQRWEEAADTYGRLSLLATTASERADFLYRRGEILRLGLEDSERANDAYLKAADLCPTHAPTLRRLVVLYFQEGEFAQAVEVARELESVAAPLDEAAIEAGLAIALSGDEARGTVVMAVAQPTAARLAEALASVRLSELGVVDVALRAAVRACAHTPEMGGAGDAKRLALLEALRARVVARADDMGARLALARLYDGANDLPRARLHYGVLTFVDPLGAAGTRLRQLGPCAPLPLSAELRPAQVHWSAQGPLRDALCALGPLTLGLRPAPLDADPAPEWTERLRPVAAQLGVIAFEAVVVVELTDPAWAEPTRPVRLLLARRALADEGLARFAVARALHMLRAGVSLIEGRTTEDVTALMRAAGQLFLPDLSTGLGGRGAGSFVQAWQAELSGLGVRPDQLSAAERAQAESALANVLTDPSAMVSASAYTAAERLTADRVALCATGDLRAALCALVPSDATTARGRIAALRNAPAIVELLAFAALIS
jgi:tetratricopeptide (TPR) repeat protein